MNESNVEVIVEWSPEKLANLPASGKYITVARFQEDLAAWPAEGWSVILEFNGKGPIGPQPTPAKASFLAPNAPIERMWAGNIFEMLEGDLVTARVTVL